MITKLEHRMLTFISYLTTILQTYPLAWGENEFVQTHTFRSHRQKWIGAINLFSNLTHVIYLAFRLVPGLGVTDEEYATIHYSIIIHVITLAAFITCLTTQIGAIWRAQELASLVNNLLNFNKSNGRKFCNGQEYAPSNLREKFICLLAAWFLLLCIVLLPMFCAIFPMNKYTIYSGLPRNWQTRCTLIITLAFECFAWGRTIVAEWFLFSNGYVYILTNEFWLRKICSEYMPSQDNVERRNVLHVYRGLRIMNTIYNNGFLSVMFPVVKAGFEACGLFSAYAVLRYRSVIEWEIYTFFALAGPFCVIQPISAVYHMAGIHDQSTELGHSFKQLPANISDRKLLTREVKSCRPVICRVGDSFVVERDEKLSYISFLVNAFVQVLLTTK